MKDHKDMYPIYLRACMLSSIIIFILLFSFIPYEEPKPYELKEEIVPIYEEILTEIDKIDEPPPQERPKVAIEAKGDITEDVSETIVETVFREDIINITPTGPDPEIVPYYKVEVKPKPINIPRPKYPEIVRMAGIEGQTVVKALVDVDGSIMEVKILKSSGNQILDEAALVAARKAKFTPAEQRDKKVRVWVSIPIRFKLTNS